MMPVSNNGKRKQDLENQFYKNVLMWAERDQLALLGSYERSGATQYFVAEIDEIMVNLKKIRNRMKEL